MSEWVLLTEATQLIEHKPYWIVVNDNGDKYRSMRQWKWNEHLSAFESPGWSIDRSSVVAIRDVVPPQWP